ncbi:MAG TPA: polysaccharide pyruvyl transferase family protein [Azospira sp.]|nr:polysaccharide pyruvyl transferase family protein [Azospira sp.]
MPPLQSLKEPVTVYFGAFDRHNFGDLLLARVAQRLHPIAVEAPVWAGLVARDLRPWGGVACESLADLAAGWEERFGERPACLIHVGGEILTTTAWQAAVMLQSPELARQAIARWDRDAEGAACWAREQLGCHRAIPYVAGRDSLPRVGWLEFRGVGGVALAGLTPPAREEVLAALRQADRLSVRERVTQAALARAGISALLEPDPAQSGSATLPAQAGVSHFAAEIGRHGAAGEVAAVRARFPQGYVAFQCGGDFADDAALAALAASLKAAVRQDGSGGQGKLGVVLFRAGAAPWHDDLALLSRLQAHLAAGPDAVPACLFQSLHLWDICALLAGARLFCGSSLHARLVARAFAVPALSLAASEAEAQGGKVAAWLSTWEPGTAVLTPARWAREAEGRGLQGCA